MPPKKDPYSSHGRKLISLFARLLFSGEPHSLIDLSRFLRCSKQTVIKLVEDIKMSYGVEIEESIQDRRRYYQLKRPGSIKPKLYFTDNEIVTLQMCKAFAEHLLGRDQIKNASQGLQKSLGLMSEQKNVSLDHFTYLPYGQIDYTPHQDKIMDIITAIQERAICKVKYKKIMADKAKTFFIKPIKIISHRDGLYLHAKMARYPDKAWKEPDYDPLLAVHRIYSFEITERKFCLPKKYDFEKQFDDSFGIIKEDKFDVQAIFSGWAAAFVQERKWSSDQRIWKRKDGTIRIKFTASSAPEIVSWLLFFGEEAMVIEPDWLVDQVTERVDELYSLYH